MSNKMVTIMQVEVVYYRFENGIVQLVEVGPFLFDAQDVTLAGA